ncbi:MAG: PIG-L family deacetylase [Pirellulaceae bacterium]|nr:PIG-L family deacetylase [Pirellulaceae bacterium]
MLSEDREPIPEAEQLDVLAVGAHPDDVEIACGGTLASLVEQGYRVGIIDLTDGEPTPRSPSPEVRLAEAVEAAKVLGVQKRITLDLPNRKLFDSFENRLKLAIEFRLYRPKIVLGFGGKTPLASPDHWQAMQLTDAAVFYSRLTKWKEHFQGLGVHTISKQLYYRLPFESATIADAPGNFVVDISATLEKKVESILCYKTQFAHREDYLVSRVRAAAVTLGMGAGYEAAEAFVTTRSIGTKNLYTFLMEN